MKVRIDNLNILLNKYAKPAVAFIGKNALNEPIMRLAGEDDNFIMECAGPDRFIKLAIESDVSKEGEAFILARVLSSLRSSHKNAEFSRENGKFTIRSSSKDRKLVLNIDTVGRDGFISINPSKIASQILGDVPLSEIKKIIARMNINPIIVLENSKALIAFLPEKKGFRVIVNDDLRVLMLEAPKSKLSFEKKLMTDFRELQSIVDAISQVSEKAAFSFTKKAVTAKGYDEEGKEVVDIKLNYSLPGVEHIERGIAIAKTCSEQEALMGFICDDNFIEVLENVITLSNIRSKKGHIDISLKGKIVTIAGAGPSSTFHESLRISKATGQGVVRVQSNVLTDITGLFSKKALFRVNKQSIQILNKWEDHSLSFFLPFLTFSRTVK